MEKRIMMMIGLVGFEIGKWIVKGIKEEWDLNEILMKKIMRG